MLLIKNAIVHSMAGAAVQADILIEQGIIKAISQNISAEGAEVLDASGLHAYPGFIDPHCHIGILEEGMGQEGEDVNEMTDPVTPQMQALDGINPRDESFQEALSAGVTCTVIGPGSANVIGGQFCALKTVGETVEEMLLKNPSAMKAALGENPKRVYAEQKRTPMTRMATAALFREAFHKARAYKKKKTLAEMEDSREYPDYNPGMEALLEVLDGDLILKIHAHRADDIQTALRLVRELQIPRYSIEHCTEGHLMAAQLKKENAPVIIGPVLITRPKIEMKNLTCGAAAKLEEAGIPFALCSDYPALPVQFLPVSAALLVKFGCSREAALRAITINAARVNGLEDRIGSLEVGKDADIALFDGDPLDIQTKNHYTVVNGVIAYRLHN